MPYAMSEGTRIYWHEEGAGDPVLLIMGLGWGSDMWYRTKRELSTGYRTIMFDNRGIGQSDFPPGPYSISMMADDAAAVLEAAGAAPAHVYGHSMGGMIAQELVLRHPEKVRSLILGGTHCGGQRSVPPTQEIINVLLAPVVNPVDSFWAIAPYIYDSATPREKIEEDLEIRIRAFPTRESYLAQLQAIMTWEACSRLSAIRIPTLVIHGETDQLIPVGNADIIAGEIPGAKLVKIAQASHVFQTDRPQECFAAIKAFLQNVS
jgi:pimeloyl-ACP methyl ester carboxylesterase